MTSKPPTMRDVARPAGVSIQTVSAVINHKPGTTRETAGRVEQAVEALGKRAVAILLDFIRAGENGLAMGETLRLPLVIIEPELVVRQSTRPCQANAPGREESRSLELTNGNHRAAK